MFTTITCINSDNDELIYREDTLEVEKERLAVNPHGKLSHVHLTYRLPVLQDQKLLVQPSAQEKARVRKDSSNRSSLPFPSLSLSLALSLSHNEL